MSKTLTKPPLHIALTHPDERQRLMLSNALKGIGATVTSGESWSSLAQHPLRLGGVWVLFDIGEETFTAVKQLRRAQERAFWGILILGQGEVSAQHQLTALGADAYLKYPFDFNSLSDQILSIAEERQPISNYQVLPPQVAAGLDKVWARFDKLSYYQLLELDQAAVPHEVKARFHQRSLMLHPDRHRNIKINHPPVYNRVNAIYKRVLEAYQTLSDPLKRPLYESMLSLGVVEWNRALEEKRKEILQISNDVEIQFALANVLSLRSRGLLKPAYELILKTRQREPNNVSIKQLASGYEVLLELASRDPEVATAIEQQVAP